MLAYVSSKFINTMNLGSNEGRVGVTEMQEETLERKMQNSGAI